MSDTDVSGYKLYCEFQDNDHASEVEALYVYTGEHCYIVRVLSARDLVTIDGANPHDPAFIYSRPKPGKSSPAEQALWIAQLEARKAIYKVWLENRVTKSPGLPLDGEEYTFETEAEMHEKLRELKEMGYHVPDHAFEKED